MNSTQGNLCAEKALHLASAGDDSVAIQPQVCPPHLVNAVRKGKLPADAATGRNNSYTIDRQPFSYFKQSVFDFGRIRMDWSRKLKFLLLNLAKVVLAFRVADRIHGSWE